MRTSTETLLSLFEWGRLLGINPWELAQVGEGFPETNHGQCPNVWFQYQWQQNFLSREEIAFAIREAEEILAHELGYWAAPRYVEETIIVPRPSQQNLFATGRTMRRQWSGAKVSWGKVAGGGTLSRTLLGADTPVAYSDNDGDSVEELFTVTIATSITSEDRIGLYFSTGDRLSPIDETWRVRPIRVTFAGGTATITGHRALLVKPRLYEEYAPQILNVGSPANFVTTVDVYDVNRDSTTSMSQGWGLWDSLPEEYDQNNPTSQSSLPLALGEVDSNLGYLSLAPLDTSCSIARAPDRAYVRYLSGVPLEHGMMNQEMADIIAHLSVALLVQGSCGCDRSQQIIDYWRSLPTTDEGGNTRPILFDEILSPTNEKRGGIYAWKRILRLRRLGVGRA